MHKTVLLNEAIDNLNIKEDGIYVDATLGFGGHSGLILKRVKRGFLFAFDQDEMAIEYSEKKLAEIGSNYEIIKSKKATYYGIGMVLARLTRAILFDENSIFTVSSYLKGEYGEKGIYIGVPSVVNRNGIREILEIELNDEEKNKFAESAKIIHEMVDEIDL